VTREHPEFREGDLRVTLLALFFVLNTPVVGMQNPKRMPYSAELILHSYVTFIAAKEQHALLAYGKERFLGQPYAPLLLLLFLLSLSSPSPSLSQERKSFILES
jgi:hypothetical protein